MGNDKLIHKGITDFEFQYEANKELARQLGVYDDATFPSFDSVAPSAYEAVGASGALVIAYNELDEIMSESDVRVSIIDRYNNLDADFCKMDVVEERERSHNFIGLIRPYRVSVVKNGLAEDSTPDFENLSYFTQLHIAGEYKGTRAMDVSDYLALSALRKIYELPAMRNLTRTLDGVSPGLPHLATSNTIGGSDTVKLGTAPATMRSSLLGIRLVTVIDCDTR